ncbi:MAG: tRNA (adenosine(37)-N6)-threonylcarbamoyltransferase complex transferase subunit TsaD [Candidatus Pacebacteria bacterium]|nr:tRNA (adenosine(37)-N6)-threonylcarbamoyltransferase complex transferase subunit TsaD [Candidatus Paceibacterota bacterium]
MNKNIKKVKINIKNFSTGMKILAIETSCDETALAVIEVHQSGSKTKFKILGNDLSSQIAIHAEYGGVFPMMAKREHGKNIINILEKVLKEAKLYKKNKTALYTDKDFKKIDKILERETELKELWPKHIPFIKKPNIDAIAVTTGPGLVPALWVGISFAKALSIYWNIPIVKVNHMEGHIFSIFPKKEKTFTISEKEIIFPMLSLLVSGGHTELILIKDWMKYKKIGQTRDDAAGEAFDKVARMLGLPYPGGPEISKIANIERENVSGRVLSDFSRSGTSSSLIRGPEKSDNTLEQIKLPRPMIYSKDYDFSFSGLKTAVLYLIRDLKEKNPNILEKGNIKQKIAREFEDSVVEVLTHKTIKAIKQYKINTLIVGGGVSANKHLQTTIIEKIKENNRASSADKLKTNVHFPSKNLTGDNALMIAIAGYFQYQNNKIVKNINSIKAQGNLSL